MSGVRNGRLARYSTCCFPKISVHLDDRDALIFAVEKIGKSLIPTMQGGNNFEVKNLGLVYDSNTTTIASYKSDGIYLNLNRGTEGISVNIYVLQSIFRHELIHYRDKDKFGNYPKENGNFTFRDHAEVYWEQMGYPDSTKKDFQNIPDNFTITIEDKKGVKHSFTILLRGLSDPLSLSL